MSDPLSSRMKQTWNTLAERNAMHFIATERSDWDQASFLRGGEETVAWLLGLAGLDARTPDPGQQALDLGCGIGRLSFALAGRYERVLGVDVSEEMVARAQQLKVTLGRDNVDFLCNNGLDLRAVPAASCDLALSYIVLQHIPERQVVLGYLSELARVVRPGGHLLFQVPVYRRHPLIQPWRLVQRLFRALLWRAEALGLVPPEKGVAFRGSRLLRRELVALLRREQLEVETMREVPTSYRFCQGLIVHARRRG